MGVWLGWGEVVVVGGGGCSGTKSQNRGALENLVKNLWKLSLLVHQR